MNTQGTYSNQGNPRTQSNTQGSYKQKTKENVATFGGVKGNKVELNLKERDMDEEAEKAFDKMIRRPRSRKYMKALKMLDSLSQGDEMIIAEMKKDAGVSAEDELTFTPEDIEAFRQRVKQQVQDIIEDENGEAQRIVAACGIEGCQIHTITSDGEVIEHWTEKDVNQKERVFSFARDIIMKHGGWDNWSYVEIYKYRLAHRNGKGDVIKIYRLDEGGNSES